MSKKNTLIEQLERSIADLEYEKSFFEKELNRVMDRIVSVSVMLAEDEKLLKSAKDEYNQ